MRLYNSDPYSGYERLKRRTPNFMDEVAEAQAVWKAEGTECDLTRSEIAGDLDDLIITWAREPAIREYEDWMYIDYDGAPRETLDLSFRRAMCSAAFIGSEHIGRPEILAIIEKFAPGQKSEVGFDSGFVSVLIDGYIASEKPFLDMLRKKLPGHLGLKATVRVTRAFYWLFPFSFGAVTGSHLYAEPPGSPRTQRHELGAAAAGYIRARRDTGPPENQIHSAEDSIYLRQIATEYRTRHQEPADTGPIIQTEKASPHGGAFVYVRRTPQAIREEGN